MPTTYNNLYLDIRQQLKQAGCPGASLEARELVCCGSGKSREEFFRDAPLYVTPETEDAIRWPISSGSGSFTACPWM